MASNVCITPTAGACEVRAVCRGWPEGPQGGTGGTEGSP